MSGNTNLKPASNRGATLIEILITTVFVTLVLVALTNLTMVSLARNRAAKEQSVATRLAQEGIDWLKSERTRRGFSELSTSLPDGIYCMDGDFHIVAYNQNTCGFSVGSDTSTYIRRLSVATPPDLPPRMIVEVAVISPGKTEAEAIKLSGEIYKWQR